MSEFSFFSELRKRKVLQAAAIYGAIAWGVTEVVVTVVEQLYLPPWISTLATIFFVVGFPVAMFLAWTFDFTAKGIQRTSVTSRRGTASIVASMVLLIAGTTGLFFLIKPSIQERVTASEPAALPVAPNTVAVLPFQNVGARPEDAYLVAGLSDALRDQLGRVSGLRIAARLSSIAVLEQGIAGKLGVAHLVDGNVRREGNVLTVSVQLIEGATGLALWSDSFERGPRELLTVQQVVAESVVANVLPGTLEVIAEPATRDPTANELLRYHEQQVRERPDVDEAALLEAIRLYREATEADPESAVAHSRLAGALIYLGDLQAAEAPIFKALSINPDLSEVQHTLGLFHWARGLVGQARAAWARAVELNPNNFEALQDYARALWYNVQLEGVADLLQRAVELDPLNLEPYATLGAFLSIDGGQPEKAAELIETIENLFDGAASFRAIAQIWDYLGEVDKSIAWTIKAHDLEPDNRAHVDKLAEYYVDIGEFDTALKLDPLGIGILFKMQRYEAMINLAEFALIDEPHDLQLRSILATANNAIGQFESARHVLEGTGLREQILRGSRTTAEWDGYVALMNAHYGLGNIEIARDLAQIVSKQGEGHTGENWWGNTSVACAQAILGRDESARESLQRAQRSTQLAWDSILKDSPCFKPLANDPVYQKTVRSFDQRRAMLRERLPATLADFGVSL
jgi:TolB-like protein/tetratricopeptide (TPR) repeat protein